MKRVCAIISSSLILCGALSTALVALACASHPTPIDGYWAGTMTMSDKVVDVVVSFDKTTGSFSSHDLMVLDAPISRLQAENGRVAFAWQADETLQFEGTLQERRITGTVNIPGLPPTLPVTFALARQSDAAPVRAYSTEALTIAGTGASLSAQIYVPRTPAPHPALVMLHGSSEGSKKTHSYDADFFAALGFEVLIFDKRGSGASTGNSRTATYDDLATDAAACLEVMRQRQSVDRGRIGLWGYSQGAMLLPLVLTKTAVPSFLIAKSPEVDGEAEAAAYSDRLRVMRTGAPAASGQIVVDSHTQVQARIRAGRDRGAVESFIRQNAQRYPFMNRTGLSGDIAIDKDEFEGLYWKGRTQDFRPLWEKVRIPTLALFGEKDEYIDPVKNVSLLSGLNNPRITTKLFPRANHALKKAVNPAEHPDVDWPRRIDASYEVVAQWIGSNVLRRHSR